MGQTFTNSIGMEFVLIPAGEFDMGTPVSQGGTDKERPVHRVKFEEPFYIGKYEVTQEQWSQIMGSNPSTIKGDNHPVETITWYDVKEFISKLNEKEKTSKYRLPSESEWEYVARAGTTTLYSFGDEVSKLGEYAWYDGNSAGSHHPVGQKKPNPWGLYDMHGNIWEWLQDMSHNNYDGAPIDGSAWEVNPSSAQRSIRSGTWRHDADHARSGYRNEAVYEHKSDYVGFRLVYDAGPVAVYHFEGNASDSSGNGYNGIIYSATFVDGVSGKGLKMDGIDDYVDIGTNHPLKNIQYTDFTIETWYKTKANHVFNGLISLVRTSGDTSCTQIQFGGTHNGRASLSISDERNWCWSYPYGDYPNGSTNSMNGINDDIWHHVVGVRKGTELLIYI